MKNWNYINGAKVGNSLGKDIYQHKLDPNQYMVVDWDKQTVTIISNGHVRDVIKNVDNLAYVLHLYKKVNAMNAKSGNESLGEYMAKKPRVINEEKTGAEEFFKKLADDVKEREKKDDKDIEKVGNAKDKNDRDMKIGDMVDVHGKKGKIQKIITAKDSRDDVIEVFFDNSGTYNPDRTDRFYANEVVKVGNVQYHKVGKITIRLEANDDDWTVYDTNGFELKSGKGGLGRAKTWAEHFARFTNKRTGNSAYDDKFAYVMREFDAGKLKTPDGKVVTDPAQAKAIAYSESKKTENGLARARKAMNKGITMWKGNDSAYIQEDGTVSYLENNSFETDKDKFESQESAIKELSKKGYVKK